MIRLLVFIALVACERAGPRDETIEVEDRTLRVVGRRAIPLDHIQDAAAKHPSWIESAVIALYYDAGHAGATIQIDRDTLIVVEGPRYRVRSNRIVEREGDRVVEPLGGQAAIDRMIRVRANDWFSRQHLVDEINAISTHYQDAGYYLATVLPDTKLDLQRAELDITTTIVRGEPFTIGAVLIEGNARMTEAQIREHVRARAGQPFNITALETTKLALEKTGAFELVAISTKQLDGNRVRVMIEVTER